MIASNIIGTAGAPPMRFKVPLVKEKFTPLMESQGCKSKETLTWPSKLKKSNGKSPLSPGDKDKCVCVEREREYLRVTLLAVQVQFVSA